MLVDSFPIADANYVVNRGVTKLFGVDVVLEGPMFLPTAQTFSEFDYDDHLSEEKFAGKGHNFEDRYTKQTHTYTGHGGDIHKDIEDMEVSRAIEASLMESKLHEKQANFLGNNDTEADNTQTDKHWAGSRRSPTTSSDDEGMEDSTSIGTSRSEGDWRRTEKSSARKNDIDREETISTSRRGGGVSSGLVLDIPRTRDTSFPEDIPGEREKVETFPTHEVTDSVTNETTRHKHIPEVCP